MGDKSQSQQTGVTWLTSPDCLPGFADEQTRLQSSLETGPHLSCLLGSLPAVLLAEY